MSSAISTPRQPLLRLVDADNPPVEREWRFTRDDAVITLRGSIDPRSQSCPIADLERVLDSIDLSVSVSRRDSR